jgi:glycosyltransferase involved in cell wall biosynthesis
MRVKLALSTLCENPRRRTGLSTLFREFVGHSRRAYPEVEWLIFAGKKEEWPADDAGVEVCRIYPSNEGRVRRLFSDHFCVAAEARKRGASALLTVGFFPMRCAGLPVAMHVFAVDNPARTGALRHSYRGWTMRRGLARAAVVITNSQWAKGRLGTASSEIVVSPEGVDHDSFKPEGASGAPGMAGRYFLWVSNLYPYKRFGLALAAYAALPEKTRAQFPLVVVGGDWCGEAARVRGLAATLGVTGDVRFLGWVEDSLLPVLYRGAIAHVLSTSEETFGRSVLEAIACGCPCVVQDLPVLREVAGASAAFVDYCDRPAATEALRRICDDDEWRKQLVSLGIARSAEFSFERLARERMDAVLTALGKIPS